MKIIPLKIFITLGGKFPENRNIIIPKSLTWNLAQNHYHCMSWCEQKIIEYTAYVFPWYSTQTSIIDIEEAHQSSTMAVVSDSLGF